jgi:hypothetical protein
LKGHLSFVWCVGSVAAFRNAGFYENDWLNAVISIKPIKTKGCLIMPRPYYTNFILKVKGIENSGGIFLNALYLSRSFGAF